MEQEKIVLDGVSFRHRGAKKNVFTKYNLVLEKGEFIVLSAKNGGGKSTLARLICGLVAPRRGNIHVDGINTKNGRQFYELRKKISMVMQNPENNLLFDRIWDDMVFGLKNLKIPKEEYEERVANALARVGMQGFENRSTYELSGGQKQRIAIAGVLAMGTEYLVVDEPTSMLDTQGKVEIYELLWKLNARGTTIILTTNILSEKQRGRVIEL
ncbi:MAG: ATP-binding cassette domain-containing protein [Firmicutes bacterium]|nr:ATP-binding cassette domain-containing protein [Bacillota bacterium]